MQRRWQQRTLGLVEIVRDGDELRAREVVREGFAPRGGPVARAGDPGLLERNHVVDVEVARERRADAVVRGHLHICRQETGGL